MPSLSPGQSISTPPSERLRIMLGGDGADMAAVMVETSAGTITSRTKDGAESGSDLVVGATVPAAGIVTVISVPDGSPIQGRLAMKFMSSQSAGSTTAAAKRTWDVRGLDAEGRTRLAVLRFHVDEGHVWTVESLIEDASHVAPRNDSAAGTPTETTGATSRARVAWGDRERVSNTIAIGVDRSASMAWAFQPGGALEVTHEGVMAAADSALDASSRITWFSYGSPAEVKAQRIRHARGDTATEVVASLKPELFSSGSRVDVDRLQELGLTNVVMVTDNLTQASRLVSSEMTGPVDAVILVGAAEDDELQPADEQMAHAALSAAGVPVLSLPAESGQVAQDDQLRQVYVDSVARFVLAHIESTNARDEG